MLLRILINLNLEIYLHDRWRCGQAESAEAGPLSRTITTSYPRMKVNYLCLQRGLLAPYFLSKWDVSYWLRLLCN